MGVKLFEEKTVEALEISINTWLKRKDIIVQDVKYSSFVKYSSVCSYSAMILYKEK